MNANDLFQAGKLGESLQAALEHVKAKPSDLAARFFLAELACFAGDWDRADRQLDAIIQQTTQGAMLSMLTRQLIRGEVLREQVFFDGRPPELIVPLSRAAEIGLEVCAALRLDQLEEAARLVAEAEIARALIPGECNDQKFSSFRDLDDRLADVLEVITTTGKYFWVPWSSIISLEFEAPQRPMDLVWRKIQINVEHGPQGEVYTPTRYPSRLSELDDALRLGRGTDWSGREGQAVVGRGLRMILADEEAMSVMELKTLSFVQEDASE